MTMTSKPHVRFAIGDADWKYARGKFRQLVGRVAAEQRYHVSVVSHDEEICQAFAADEVEVLHSPGNRIHLTPAHTVAMTELMIKLTRDVAFPESRLDLWKVTAMDDYLGSLDHVTHAPLPGKPDLLVYPLMGIDNNSAAASHLYAAILLEASRAKIPVLGLEVSLLGNKQTLGASLADYFAVKSEFARDFVVREELAPAARTFVLPAAESYFLTCRNDAYWDDFFTQENKLRARLGINGDHAVIFIPHHVAFVYEIRELLRSLKSLPFPFTVLLRADPNIARQGLKEREIAERVYRDEIAALPNVIVDDHGGWLWSLLLADVVLAPIHSVFTELGASYGKFTVVSQGRGDSERISENLLIEPRPQQAVSALRFWIDHHVHRRFSLSQILQCILARRSESVRSGVHDGA
jgi:hypothetical protein